MGVGPTGPGAVALVLCAAVLVASTSGASAVAAGEAASSQSIERDSVLLRVDVQEDGVAHWRIEYRTRLDDEESSQAFESLERDIEEDPDAYSREFFEGIDATIATAENATGREMNGTNYSVDASVNHLPRRHGVVVYSFTWHGFASNEDDRLRIGDALAGFFLGENERLLISWPEGYELSSVRPSADERRDRGVVWNGPMEFGPEEPRLIATRLASPSWRLPWPTVAVVGALFALAGAAWWLRRRNPGAGARTDEEDAGLLSNEERVLRVLEQRGGRARQQEIVDALDWTEAKTSRVISTLREQGRIDSFRLGRENVLALPDAEE